jgi:glycosyltransferase involved in cell wall biosynthesis
MEFIMSSVKETKPMVSIIIPVYNGSNYLAEAIDSALAQTYENVEVIVVNDGSKDDGATEKIALSYGEKIRYVKKENGGVSSALNLGIEKMQGEYFSWLSHDDKYEPQKIEKQVETIVNSSVKEAVVLCTSKNIDKDSVLLEKRYSKKRFNCNGLISWKEAFISMFSQGVYNGCGFLIHKSIFEKVGKFNQELRYAQDLLMWTKIFLNKIPLIYMQDALVLSRIHGGQLTQTGRQLFHKEAKLLAEMILSEILRNNEDLEELIYIVAKYNATYNNKDVVKFILSDKRYKLSLVNKFKIRIRNVYGSIRPFIRRVYYKFFLNVKTQ